MVQRKLGVNFDRITNIAVVIAAILLISLFGKAYFFAAPPRSSPDPVKRGTVLRSIEGVDLHKSLRTLVLALSTNCRYCTQSLPFYKELMTRAAKEAAGSVQMVAVFPEQRADVDAYTKTHELPIDSVAGVNLRSLQIPFTPSLILVDSNAEVLGSWGGKLSEEEQKNVFNTLAESTKAVESNGPPPVAITQTVSLFDENRPVSNIKPSDEELVRGDPNDDKILNVARRQVNHFAVDPQGNTYLLLWHRIIAYNGDGKVLWSATTPEGFKGAFCVDDRGRLYIPDKAGLEIYSASSAPNLIVPASKLPYSEQALVIKIVNDAAYNRLYIQTYDPVAVSQSLFSLDLATAENQTIYQQRNQVKFTPTYAPGAFDFALGTDQVFVSDIYDYKVYMYSRSTGKYTAEFHRSMSPRPVNDKDGFLVNRKMTVGNLTGPGMLKNYSPILHLGFTNQGYVVVWTSQRDPQLRQRVDVYDSKMNFLGVDLKYADPGFSNYVFANGKVYVPDLGFGRPFRTQGISPLDVPSKPLGLKVFDDSFHRI
jgi:hypothetical protein